MLVARARKCERERKKHKLGVQDRFEYREWMHNSSTKTTKLQLHFLMQSGSGFTYLLSQVQASMDCQGS